MKWASALSEQTPLSNAIEECVSRVNQQLDGAAANLAVVFASFHYQEQFEDIPGLIRDQLNSPLVLGCSGGGIIGNGLEVEQQPALSITVASLPNVILKAFHLQADNLPDLDAGPQTWEDLLRVVKSDEPQFILLADPYSFPAQNLILGLDFAFDQSAKIGGLASGAQQQGQNALFLEGQVYRSGAVGVAMSGNVVVDTVVAQGCRPIGKPMHITQSQRNLLGGLDGRPPLEVLRELLEGLNERDRGLMRTSLFLGVVMDGFIDEPRQGDFLIRNVMGMDDRAGVLSIGEVLKEGQLVQFHLRDAETSAEDLVAVLDRYAGENRENQAQGALLFSCLGRGQYLYGKSNHDTEIFQNKLGSVPLGGFFCNGEIGPVSGTTFLHGYTSSFGIFRPKY